MIIRGKNIYFDEEYALLFVSGTASFTDTFESYADGAFLHEQPGWEKVNNLGTYVIYVSGSEHALVGTNGNTQRSNRINTPIFNENQRAEMTYVRTDQFGATGPCVRVQALSQSFYNAHYESGNVYYGTVVNGSWNHHGSFGTGTFPSGSKLSIEASGSGTGARITIKYDVGSGWVVGVDKLDPGIYHGGGQPGVYSYYTLGRPDLGVTKFYATDIPV